ncbi:MAG: DUF1552 domain-containing protein [Myxococcales bacterium]|nr:DUF1552 domain-containing protein [Myxococcales bacterium]
MSLYDIKKKGPRLGRRHFLVGAGGASLAIPFLGSLEPAAAGDPPYAPNPRFVCMATGHGGVWNSNMYPDLSTASQARNIYPNHDMHYGPLAASSAGGTTTISACLSAPSTALPQSLVDKLNVIRGLDIVEYMGHHTGGPLGNFARRDGEGDENLEYIPTIDQLMAWSPNFYPDIDAILLRSMHIANGYSRMSWGWVNPNDPSAGVAEVPRANSSIALFNQIFVPPEMPEENPRPLIVDKIYEHYRRVQTGAFGDASRLSKEDKLRLEAHMERLLELERKLNVVASCGEITEPTQDANDADFSNVAGMGSFYELYNDVVVAAFVCGTSRIAIYGQDFAFTDDTNWNDWHQEVAHVGGGGIDPAEVNQPGWQNILTDNHRNFFQHAFLDLCNKLDAVDEGNGITALDNSLVMWTQESGHETHSNVGTPVVTAGSAAGFFNTGQYVDLRRRDVKMGQDKAEDNTWRPGILYNQWLANVLQAMNLTPAEFEMGGRKGYGIDLPRHDYWTGADPMAMWPDHLFAGASGLIPQLVKGV